MALPWKTLESFTTDNEGVLELRQRGKGDYLITLGSQVLMNSKAQRSEMALGELGCRKLRDHRAPKVMVGGLGMGITLRAVLDTLPATAEVVVAELNPTIHKWCLGPLLELTDAAVIDPRVSVVITDVAALIRSAEQGSYDAIILDLYRGPGPQSDPVNDPLYGSRAIDHCRTALKSSGVLAVWGENPDSGFEGRLDSGGFVVRCERPGKGGYRHAVWVAEKTSAARPLNRHPKK